jgi:hypothetical protein
MLATVPKVQIVPVVPKVEMEEPARKEIGDRKHSTRRKHEAAS